MSRVVFFEFPAQDAQRAQKFYEQVFGWQFSAWPGPEPYWLIKTGEGGAGIDGGMMTRPGPVTNTMAVEDLDATLAKVELEGGVIVVPKMEIPNVGWLAYFKDTEGNIFGVMQALSPAK
jgi:hypothetical protein